jgi:hypothetical protein
MSFPVFASGDVLNASDMNAVGSWLLKTTTVASGSEILMDDVFSSSYDQYQVVFRLTGASTTQSIYYQNRVGGANAASNYETMSAGYRPTNATASVASSIVGTTFLFLAGSTTADFASGDFTVFSPQKATPTQMIGDLLGIDGTSSYSLTLGGRHTTATAYTGFRIYPSTGTFSGTCRVYGLRN